MRQESIDAFVRARGQRPAWPGIDPALRPGTIADGYRLQAAIHDRLAAAGDARVGWKVGSTSAAGQRGFGLTEPVYAGLLASGRSASLTEALSRPLTRPSVECEILVVLRRDIDGADPALSAAAIPDAIGACHIGCEIIDGRYDDPASVGVPSLIADDFFQVGFVVGPENPAWREPGPDRGRGFHRDRRTTLERIGPGCADRVRTRCCGWPRPWRAAGCRCAPGTSC